MRGLQDKVIVVCAGGTGTNDGPSNRASIGAAAALREATVSSAAGASVPGNGRSRSGANSTLSLRPVAPRAARNSLSSGSRTIAVSIDRP